MRLTRLLLILVLLASPASAFGPLPDHDPDAEPVMLRYRAFPLSPFVVSFDYAVKLGEAPLTGTGKLRGTMSAVERGINIVQTVSLMDVTLETEGMDIEQMFPIKALLPMIFEVTIEPRGRVTSIHANLSGPLWQAMEPDEREGILQSLDDMVAESVDHYPATPVRAGDHVRSMSMPLDLGDETAEADYHAIARGGFTYNNRPGILVQSLLKLKSSTFSLAGGGYTAIDHGSGMPVYGNESYVLEAHTGDAGTSATMDLSYEYSMTIETAANDADDSTLEGRLRAIKSLLDQGLISEDEAAEKRRSLLQEY
ncbi:MAG: hypothetical protein RIC16_04660 [Rhodospirillales bacterium]